MIKKNDAPLEHYLDLAARQFVELECICPCEKTVGRAVSAIMELTDTTLKYNAKEKVDKVELLKNYIKFHVKARGTHDYNAACNQHNLGNQIYIFRLMTNYVMTIACAARQRGEKFTRTVDTIFTYPSAPGDLPEALWANAYGNDPPHAIAAGGKINVRRSSNAVKTAVSTTVAKHAPIQLNLGSSSANTVMPQNFQDLMITSFQQMFQQQMMTLMNNMGGMNGMGGMGGMGRTEGTGLADMDGCKSQLHGLNHPKGICRLPPSLANSQETDSQSLTPIQDDSQGALEDRQEPSDSAGSLIPFSPPFSKASDVAGHVQAMAAAMDARSQQVKADQKAKGGKGGKNGKNGKNGKAGKTNGKGLKTTGKTSDSDGAAGSVLKRPAAHNVRKRPSAATEPLGISIHLPTPNKAEARRFKSRGSYTSKYSHDTKRKCLQSGMSEDDARRKASEYYRMAAAVWDAM